MPAAHRSHSQAHEDATLSVTYIVIGMALCAITLLISIAFSSVALFATALVERSTTHLGDVRVMQVRVATREIPRGRSGGVVRTASRLAADWGGGIIQVAAKQHYMSERHETLHEDGSRGLGQLHVISAANSRSKAGPHIRDLTY